jgi:hypothetical protein
MDFLGNLVLIGVLVVVICIVLYAAIVRILSGKRRRRKYEASLGNALQQLQAIAIPSIQYQIEEKLKERKEEDDQGGPDDPGAYYRRLRDRIDQRTRNGVGIGDDGEAEP